MQSLSDMLKDCFYEISDQSQSRITSFELKRAFFFFDVFVGSKPFSGPIFSRRFPSEKCPTITRAAFFRQTTDITLYVPFLCTVHFYLVLDFERISSL